MPLVSIYREIDLAATIEYPKSISRQRRIQHSANVFLDQHDWQLSAGAKSQNVSLEKGVILKKHRVPPPDVTVEHYSPIPGGSLGGIIARMPRRSRC
jgi:hypothetical protein